MKKFLCYDTNDAASGRVNVSANGVLKPNSTVPSTNGASYQQLVTDGDGNTRWEDKMVVDSELSDTSTNPVQNKVIKAALDALGVQSDWNQNDDTQPDYVKNRPFYAGDPVETVLVEERTVTFTENNGLYNTEFPSTFAAIVGETYKVSWDGATYECTCVDFSGAPFLGNLSILGAGSDTGEPFVMAVPNGQSIVVITADTSASHTFSISGLVPEVVKIDEKYLPDTVATKSAVEAAQTTANAAQTTADKNKETLSQMLTYVLTFAFDKQTSGRDTFKFNAYNHYKISDFNPAPDDVISFTGTRESGVNYSKIITGNNCVQYGLFIVVASAGVCSLPVTDTDTYSFTAPSAGLYACYEENYSQVTAGTGKFTLRVPDGSLSGTSLLLKSSTDGSDKQFRITVDDSGTLTATEVTS